MNFGVLYHVHHLIHTIHSFTVAKSRVLSPFHVIEQIRIKQIYPVDIAYFHFGTSDNAILIIIPKILFKFLKILRITCIKNKKMCKCAQLFCSLLTAISQLSVLIGYKMRLADGHKGNEMRNEIFAD